MPPIPLLSLEPLSLLETTDNGLLLFRDSVSLNFNKIQNLYNILKTLEVYTSTTRPSTPYIGQTIWETDTSTLSIWDGTEWRRSASTPSAAYVANLGVATGNTASAAYVDFPGPIDLAFTKRANATSLEIDQRISCFINGANSLDIGVRINSIDYTVAHFFFNDAFSHRHFTGLLQIGGISAGLYAARIRWRVAGGATIQTDGNDVAIMKITEMK